MRYSLVILFSFITLYTLADGGDADKRVKIENYEPNLNLQFIGIEDTIKYVDKKKDLTAFVVSNIAVYDISNNKTNYVFKDSEKRHIVGFYFESKYINEHKTIEFNNGSEFSNSEKNGLFEYSNNRNVANRPLSDNLIIITEDLVSKKLTFWITDKFGNATKKEIEISNDWNWEIDVKNRMIRFTKQFNQKIEIKNIKY